MTQQRATCRARSDSEEDHPKSDLGDEQPEAKE
jgi:hypothetical protein